MREQKREGWGSIVSRYGKMEGRKECCYALFISCKKL